MTAYLRAGLLPPARLRGPLSATAVCGADPSLLKSLSHEDLII